MKKLLFIVGGGILAYVLLTGAKKTAAQVSNETGNKAFEDAKSESKTEVAQQTTSTQQALDTTKTDTIKDTTSDTLKDTTSDTSNPQAGQTTSGGDKIDTGSQTSNTDSIGGVVFLG